MLEDGVQVAGTRLMAVTLHAQSLFSNLHWAPSMYPFQMEFPSLSPHWWVVWVVTGMRYSHESLYPTSFCLGSSSRKCQ